jgi:hypothetical protein
VGPIREGQQQPIRQEQHHQRREQREKYDNKEPLRSTDEALKLFDLIDHSFDGLGDAHAPDAPQIHRYALLQLVIWKTYK